MIEAARAAIDSGLEELGCQALLVVGSSARDPDLAPFVGPVHLTQAFVVMGRAQPPRLAYLTPMERDEAAATGLALLAPELLEVARWWRELPTGEAAMAKVLSRAFEECGIEPGRIALAGQGEVGEMHAAARILEGEGWTLVSGASLARTARKQKDEGQLRAARRVAAATTTAMRGVAELLAGSEVRDGELWLQGERLKVGRLRMEVARTLAALGLEQPVGNIIAPAEEGAVPHNSGTDSRVLRSSESLVVDLYPRGWLYADCTRTFCVGTPPEALVAAHGSLLRVLDRVERKLRGRAEGKALRASSLQDAACSLLSADGYATPLTDPGTEVGYVHNLGHGVGFELHEYPSFRREAGAEGVLETGDLITIEPGLYDPHAGFGIRLEDEIFLAPEGPEKLTDLPYDLDPRAW